MSKTDFSLSDGSFYNAFSNVFNYESFQACRPPLFCLRACAHTHTHTPTHLHTTTITTGGNHYLEDVMYITRT